MTKFRIEMTNNSDARNADILSSLRIKAKHNGGKTVIAVVDASRTEAVKALLDESHKVASYATTEE